MKLYDLNAHHPYYKMKRKLTSCIVPVAKKIRSLPWVSASRLRNYMLNDPLCDYFDVVVDGKTGVCKSLSLKRKPSFLTYIMSCGDKYERHVIKHIHNKIHPIYRPDTYQDVCKAIQRKEPIIEQALLENQTNNTRGVADLLVLGKWLSKFTIDELEDINDESYYVIDIKWTTIPIRLNGMVSNSKAMPAYKAQVYIYTDALNQIQKHPVQKGFLIDRFWLESPSLAMIDYGGFDKSYVKQTANAVSWYQDLLDMGHTWTLNPPSRPELRPNLCVYNDRWQTRKQELADSIDDITKLWFCGTKQREKAMEKGIEKWTDPKCSAETLEISGKRAPVLDAILHINRETTKDLFLPKQLHIKKYQHEFFIDCETVSRVLVDGDNGNVVFMVGLGWVDNHGKWQYKPFTAKRISKREEHKLMRKVQAFLRLYKNPVLYYWHAEQTYVDRIGVNLNCKMIDMCKLFRETPITIKGCFNFGLKNVAYALRSHGFIKSKWNECDNGMCAMMLAIDHYVNGNDVIKEVEDYNEVDCKVLHEILSFIRKKMK